MPKLSEMFLKRDKVDGATSWYKKRGAEYLIACASNQAYKDEVRRVPVSIQQLQKESGKPEKDNHYIKALAKYILLDWKNVLDEEGKELQCNMKNKIMLLTKYEEIGLLIVDYSSDIENFLHCNYKDELKN